MLFAACPANPPANNSIVANKPITEQEPQKGRSDPKLQRESDALLSLFENLPRVKVFVTDEPLEKAGSNVERGVAYTDCSMEKVPTIYVKNPFYSKANRKQLVNILKHELTHAWFCTQGIQTGHDARFRKKFTEVGGFGN